MSLLDTFRVPTELEPAVRNSYRREQWTELSMPLATGLLEGGFVAVLAAKAFDAQPWMIAVISAASMFGNLSSFFWNRLAMGRAKVPVVTALQVVVLVCVAAIAQSPVYLGGLDSGGRGGAEPVADCRHHHLAQHCLEPEL